MFKVIVFFIIGYAVGAAKSGGSKKSATEHDDSDYMSFLHMLVHKYYKMSKSAFGGQLKIKTPEYWLYRLRSSANLGIDEVVESESEDIAMRLNTDNDILPQNKVN